MSYDDLEERIVNVLVEDGRASLRSIAEELDVAVTTVSNYLDDLEEEGVVKGYEPQLNYDALGYDVTAVIHLRLDGEALGTFADDLRTHEQLTCVYEVTGHYDIVAVGTFVDTDEMNDEIKSLLTSAAIEETATSVVLSTACERRQFQVGVEDD